MTTTNESVLRGEITHVGQNLYARGYTVGTAGNISAYLPDGWLITPIDACLDTLNPARIAKMLVTGEWVNGGKPSKTLALCHGIYDHSAEAHIVVYTHSTHLVALTLAGVWHEADVLSPITPYYMMKVGHVSLIMHRRPGHLDVTAWVAALANDTHVVLLDRLGPVVWHDSMLTVAYALEELKEAARLWLVTGPKLASPSGAQIGELYQTSGVRWQSNRQRIGSARRSAHITLTLETK